MEETSLRVGVVLLLRLFNTKINHKHNSDLTTNQFRHSNTTTATPQPNSSKGSELSNKTTKFIERKSIWPDFFAGFTRICRQEAFSNHRSCRKVHASSPPRRWHIMTTKNPQKKIPIFYHLDVSVDVVLPVTGRPFRTLSGWQWQAAAAAIGGDRRASSGLSLLLPPSSGWELNLDILSIYPCPSKLSHCSFKIDNGQSVQIIMPAQQSAHLNSSVQ